MSTEILEMSCNFDDLQEFITLRVPLQDEDSSTIHVSQSNSSQQRIAITTDTNQVWVWTTNHTKLLLDLYKTYKPKVGTQQIKNFKKLWEIVSHELSKILGTTVSPSQCENRWRVLERAYKKHIDDQNKTGRGRRYFEYLQEMNDIFKNKKNIKPAIVLSATTVAEMPVDILDDIDTSSKSSDCNINKTAPSTSQVTTPKKVLGKMGNPVINRNVTLEKMRKDKKEYYDERLKLEREKVEVYKEKLNVLKERNRLLEERNALKSKTSS